MSKFDISLPIWNCSRLTCYVGGAPDGLEWSRYSAMCEPGLWTVCVTGWVGMRCNAVIDDFGNLVSVS